MLTMLSSLRLINSKQTMSSNQCLCCSWSKTKLQNLGAGNPSLTILIDHSSHAVLPTIDRLGWLTRGVDPGVVRFWSPENMSSNQCLCCYSWLKLSWPKTKLQNVGAGDPPSKIPIEGVPVEGVEFIYLGNKQSCSGYYRPDLLHRIELACSVMNSLQRVWNCSSLSISTKVHLYQALIRSDLL